MEEFLAKIKSLGKKTLVILLVIGIAVIAFLFWGSYSSGERVGKIIKLSQKGVVFKTWEGQLGMESFGAVSSNNQFSQTFEFSVKGNSDEVLEQLKKAMNENRRVNIQYDEKYITLPWWGDTKYLIRSVTVLDQDQNSTNPNPF